MPVGPGSRRLDLGGQREQQPLLGRVARPASRRPAARRASSAAAARSPGIPVTFHADVHGVNAFCASKSAAGSSSSRIAPTGSGGAARVGVSTASYGASAVSAAGGEPAHRADREAELRPAHRSARARPATGSAAAAARSCVRAARPTAPSAPPSRSRRPAPPRAASAPRCPRPRGPATRAAREASSQAATHAGSTAASAITARRTGRSAAGPARGRTRRGTASAGAGAQDGSPTPRPASTSSSAAASRTVRASGPGRREADRVAVHRVAADPAARRLQPDEPAAADAGIRIEPPPSEPCATGTSPAATAAAAPPLRPARHPGRGPTASPPAARPRARCSRASRTPACSSCRGSPSRPPRSRSDHLVGDVGHEVGERRRAEGGPHAGGEVQVLDRGRYAVQRPGALGHRAQRRRPATARARGSGSRTRRPRRPARGSATRARAATPRRGVRRRPARGRSGRAARSRRDATRAAARVVCLTTRPSALRAHDRSTSCRRSPKVSPSSSASQDASITLWPTPTVTHDDSPSEVSISTRVIASVPWPWSRIRTL